MKGKNISTKRKSLIMAEAALPGCIISKLARTHNISKGTIYSWLRESKISKDITPGNQGDFVEVVVSDTRPTISNIKNNNHLQKASLEFAALSIVVEGKISASKLIGIIQLLEERC